MKLNDSFLNPDRNPTPEEQKEYFQWDDHSLSMLPKFPPAFYHGRCWFCGETIHRGGQKCPECGIYICSKCNNCALDCEFSAKGFNSCRTYRNGTPYTENGYDFEGFDPDGYNSQGYDKNGFDRDGYNQQGYDCSGYNSSGYNQNGYDKSGYDQNGLNCGGQTWVENHPEEQYIGKRLSYPKLYGDGTIVHGKKADDDIAVTVSFDNGKEISGLRLYAALEKNIIIWI